jgi:hypothetical protein
MPGYHSFQRFNYMYAVFLNLETLTDAELGLADLPESHSRITDSGMQLVGQCFLSLKKLEIHNCPNLINPLLWVTPGI